MSVIIATDGSCIGNPGPGAFAIVAHIDRDTPNNMFERAVPYPATTVGEMEVRGLLEALLFIIDNAMWNYGPITIKCDAQYVVNGFNEWMANWEAKGWHKKGGLAHAALWKEIASAKALYAELSRGNSLIVEWVKAHQTDGCPFNARADELANTCARHQVGRNVPALQDTLSDISQRLQAANLRPSQTVKQQAANDASPITAQTLLAEALDLVPRISDDDPMSPALADWCARVRSALSQAA